MVESQAESQVLEWRFKVGISKIKEIQCDFIWSINNHLLSDYHALVTELKPGDAKKKKKKSQTSSYLLTF